MKESVLDLAIDDGPFVLNKSNEPWSYTLISLATSILIYGYYW